VGNDTGMWRHAGRLVTIIAGKAQAEAERYAGGNRGHVCSVTLGILPVGALDGEVVDADELFIAVHAGLVAFAQLIAEGIGKGVARRQGAIGKILVVPVDA